MITLKIRKQHRTLMVCRVTDFLLCQIRPQLQHHRGSISTSAIFSLIPHITIYSTTFRTVASRLEHRISADHHNHSKLPAAVYRRGAHLCNHFFHVVYIANIYILHSNRARLE